MNKQDFLKAVIRTRKVKGKNLTKKELTDIFSGIRAMENLGAFDKENWKEKSNIQTIGDILKGARNGT